jgi:hypothetical protein
VVEQRKKRKECFVGKDDAIKSSPQLLILPQLLSTTSCSAVPLCVRLAFIQFRPRCEQQATMNRDFPVDPLDFGDDPFHYEELPKTVVPHRHPSFFSRIFKTGIPGILLIVFHIVSHIILISYFISYVRYHREG